MESNVFEEIRELIMSINDDDEAFRILSKIEDAYSVKLLTEKQVEYLKEEISQECMINDINLNNDDSIWEDMCLSNPDLREQ
ncbi:hypothetical protein [Priestia megaterium]|uniref:hypothetical protein n=1 Tax=Priestia megaterium TaxID=1404 RepID=UPI002877D3AF|nr:hypothetical protein [Priestia megaterium]